VSFYGTSRRHRAGSAASNLPACQNPGLLDTGLYQQAGSGGSVTSDFGGGTRMTTFIWTVS
jgi:hypothetical protein